MWDQVNERRFPCSSYSAAHLFTHSFTPRARELHLAGSCGYMAKLRVVTAARDVSQGSLGAGSTDPGGVGRGPGNFLLARKMKRVGRQGCFREGAQIQHGCPVN